MISRRLAGAPRRVGERLRDDLLAAERDDEHRADVRMPRSRPRASRASTRMSGPSWPQPARCGSATPTAGSALAMRSRDDRRADHRRHDEHVIAHADAAVRPPIARETRTFSHPRALRPRASAVALVGRLGQPHARLGATRARPRSPRPRLLATLCVCTCAPAVNRRRRHADRAAVLDDRARRPRCRTSAILCPDGIARAPRPACRADVEARAPARAARAPWRRCRAR